VVSAAILNDAALDAAQLRVEALRDLDVPQIRALERLQRLLNEYKEEKEESAYCDEAVQQVWASEPQPIRAALARTGVASHPESPTFTQSKASMSSARVFFGSYTTSTLSTGREPGSRLPNRPHAGTNCSPKDSKRNAGSGDVPAFVLVLLTRSVTYLSVARPRTECRPASFLSCNCRHSGLDTAWQVQ
jgi:hypothetical protein